MISIRKKKTQGSVPKVEHSMAPSSEIRILGTGCAKCKSLEESVRGALADLGMNVPVVHTTDPASIASWGVMRTPALVLNNKVVAAGRILSRDQVKALVEQALLKQGAAIASEGRPS